MRIEHVIDGRAARVQDHDGLRDVYTVQTVVEYGVAAALPADLWAEFVDQDHTYGPTYDRVTRNRTDR